MPFGSGDTDDRYLLADLVEQLYALPEHSGSGRDRSRINPKVVAIEPFSAHQLRHTFITMCHEAGVDVKVTQEIAGHADIHTTLMIYTHLTDAKRQEGIRTLNAHLQGTLTEPAENV